MKRTITIMAMVILLLPDPFFADPRSQTVDFTCGKTLGTNRSLFVHNFVATLENISDQIRILGYGTAVTGSGPDAHYGLAQCYGDLSPVDCFLCYAQARTTIPQCYPYNAGQIYLDGCFMRSTNYSFFNEYNGPKDRSICGNVTRNEFSFRESARRAIARAVLAAPNNNGFARAHVAISRATNGSAYVLANCWRSINASSCRACLENASSSILSCLPASEARALKTGCFMRYSDIDFLNPIPILRNGSPRGRVIVTAIAATVGIGKFFYSTSRTELQ